MTVKLIAYYLHALGKHLKILGSVLYVTHTRAKMESPNVKAMRMMEAEVSVAIESLFSRKRTTVMPAKSGRNNGPS